MSQFEPGKLIKLSRLTHRIVAPNAGPMTGPGTNTYLVGHKQLAVIDPGPNNASHIEAILKGADAIKGSIQWILCTHTHPDHSPGCIALQAETGASTYGQPAPAGQSQDRDFKPQNIWQDHEKLRCDEFSLRALHTPGHASNHWCYLLEDENLLFSGDHIMNGSTVVIAPPDGNMMDYLNSLHKLKPEAIDHIAPGHGDIMNNPQDVIEETIQHRLMRENKTLEKLEKLQAADLDELVTEVYDEVPVFLHPLAKRSLAAHLEKLQAEGRIRQTHLQWSIT
ncbi:MAG: MBL fold metallo-hydrolase [Gammaproteobacteria bacterium]|nr:MAG: MBL fold metallo-hydrolase [Gammaproteobacteria bacterium]